MRRIIAAGVLITLLSPGDALATPASGFSATIVARGTISKGIVSAPPGASHSGLSPSWEDEFRRVHGRTPTSADKADRIWSLEFLARTGREPAPENWLARWNELQQPTDIVVVETTIEPGGSGGWHSHPGPAVVFVQSGAITLYSGGDGMCTPHRYTAGQVGVEFPHEVMNPINESTTTPAVVLVTFYNVPVGGPARIDKPNPGSCPI